MELNNLLEILKIIVIASVLFVWVVRYDNIIVEFKQFGLPAWLRDLVGILKISFVIMLVNDATSVVSFGASGIILLMLGAFATHIRVKNPFSKMIPSLTLMAFSIVILATSN